MRIALRTVACLLLAFSLTAFASAADSPRVVTKFDADWRFLKGEAKNAEAVDYDDSSWRKLDVPHDWSIEGPFDEKNPSGGAGGFLPAGVGWYRKHFSLPAEDKNRRVFIEFDGVMANSEVWINGHSLGKRPFGYVSFRYDMTNHLKFGDGQTNVLTVRCDNSEQPASRWYTGAGMYRHVHLEVTDPVHLDLWPQFVTTPEIAADRAIIRVHSKVVNQLDSSCELSVQTKIEDPSGTVVAKPPTDATQDISIPAGQSAEFEEVFALRPRLWNLDDPFLYHARTEMTSSGKTLDESVATFGIRDAKFEADTGFWLNGKNFKLKGACLHHDAGALGAAVPASVWRSRLEQLKELGVNAIRTSHNPPSPELLDLCDQLGFVVMDEMFDCWLVAKERYDYHSYFKDWWQVDTTDTLLRDRNHPSIVIYSAGNEIHDITPRDDRGTKIFVPIHDLMHQLDPTRPVTLAVLRPNQNNVYAKGGLAEYMDVVGQNYRENEIVAAHKANPAFKILGTENHHDIGAWIFLRDNPPYAGQFLWTGFDYLGESRAWPNVGYNWGLIDRTGVVHGVGYQRQSWWSDKPMVHIVRRSRPQASGPSATNAERLPRLYSDWTPRVDAGTPVNVEVYSNCDDVELFLNDKSHGSRPRPDDNASPRQWNVPFEAGLLKAVAKNHDQIVATHELRTAGSAVKLIVTADRTKLPNDWDEVALIRAEVVDENGIVVPDAQPEPIEFQVSGPGAIVATDGGDPTSHAPFQTNLVFPYQGQCLAILRSTAPTGEITVAATNTRLRKASVSVSAADSR
jgi:beta-galactosidase